MKRSVWLLLVLLTACSSGPETALERSASESKGMIDSTMAHHREEFGRCYEKHSGKARREGKVEVRFTYDKAGRVTKAAIASSTLKSPKVEKCLLKELRGIDFPVIPEGGTREVTYPFSFHFQR